MSLNDNQPAHCLKSPEIQDIIPVGESTSNLASDLTVKFIEDDKNVMKERLKNTPKYRPFHLEDPDDQTISWYNSLGSKTCLKIPEDW